MKKRAFLSTLCIGLFLATISVGGICAQSVKRVVVVKVDGLPGYFVDKFVHERDPETGRSQLPWFEEIFYKNGTRVPNFYTRGMSLSGPSWGQLDTGQHLQIKGNVEYDRLTMHGYDYLNFIPYYIDYARKKKADMPAVEVLDELKIPLLLDAFPYEKRYNSQQLYQRGTSWEVIASGFIKLFPGDPRDLVDEWTLGIPFRNITSDQTQRDIVGKLAKRPEIDYYDFYDTAFDHVSHHNNDTESRLIELKELDRRIGKIWTAIKSSSRAGETALVIVSDHGVNSQDKVYSQGFNLVKMLASAAGGGHHVITKRRLMLDYSIKGVNPLVPLITTTSNYSYYLKKQSSEYPTALVDFDGNERSSIHLRNSDLNILHILLQQLKGGNLSPELKAAATDAFFDVIDRHRSDWLATAKGLSDELDALHRSVETRRGRDAGQPTKFSADEIARGLDKKAVRAKALTAIDADFEADYRKYLQTLLNLLSLKREFFDPSKIEIKDLIAEGAMGDSNSIYDLQNYVIGLSQFGLVLNAENDLDLTRSFRRINYFDLLHDQKVRSNVQPGVSDRPVDFVAVRIPADAIRASLGADPEINEDPIWVYGGPDSQALILSRMDADGKQSYRYLPVSHLSQDKSGEVSFEPQDWRPGLPLKFYEDVDLAVPTSDRAAWLSKWHTELEWLNATHKTIYSNAIIGLNEQVDRHPLNFPQSERESADEKLIESFRQRQRHLTEADMLILANDHWNFDVRGFNPGGNHGSFFRVSTNATFMIAGGANTNIPRGLAIQQPYDGLSFMPTILRLMGKIDDAGQPTIELKNEGFQRFPGRIIKELTEPQIASESQK